MKTLMIIAVAAIMMVSCKKTEYKTIHDTVTVTKTDTVHTNTTNTVTVHDTIHVVAQDLVGLWKVYKIDDVNSGVDSYSNETWEFNFTSTQIQEDYNADGVWDNTYNIVYGANYVDIYYTSTPTTLTLSSVGSEYRLTRVISSTQSQIWYLKK